ncbi:MAG: ABC transporter substrate-binding protein [Candidatus Promineifilaceae bacterium]
MKVDKLSSGSMSDLPEGTVTFLFTDIEGSTKLLRQLGDEYAKLLSDQRRICRAIFDTWHGHEIDTQGDSFFVSFPRATEAAAAAVEIQRALAEHSWPHGAQVRLRMGLHTGEPLAADEGYVGMDVHRAARIAHIGHGGQVLLSATTTELIIDELPEGVSLLDLGRHRLKDIARPEHIRQLVIDGFPSEFPPLKSLEALGLEVPAEKPVRMPSFLEKDAADEPEPVFLGRKRELERLSAQLDKAIDGHGGIFFVTGDAGSGKTALFDALCRELLRRVPDLLVARGTCSAFTGSGDPYAPFRTVLRQLTGDIETAWKGGLIQKEDAVRLWSSIPSSTKALIKRGPNLIDTFIPGPALLERIGSAAPADGALLNEAKRLVEGEKTALGSLEQQGLFEEVRDVLVELAINVPLLILIDDMQWADSGSINLLFHLGRELAGTRVLVVGAYRPEDVALGRDNAQHPLEPVLNELKRTSGEIWINLNQIQGERFVDELLDTEPNHLGGLFRKKLYEHTAGHALFTVELLRDMQERGDLVKNSDGRWIESPELDWNLLPTRVEGVIENRIGRLQDELREVLSIASVEGEDFTAQVIARIRKTEERDLLRSLSGELIKRHKLIKEGQVIRMGSTLLSRYRFTHTLFQRYLYKDLSEVERRLLHGEIGAILEELYSGELEDMALQLGTHFAESGDVDKAINYLTLAGDRAYLIFAFEEAAAAYEKVLKLLRQENDQRMTVRILMRLGQIYHANFQFERSRKAFDEAFAIQSVARVKASQLANDLRTFRDPIDYDPPSTLDPIAATTAIQGFYLNQLFAGLVEVSIKADIAPDVAFRWDILDEGRRYVFHLRTDALWSDGHPVTADDFVFSWLRALKPGSPIYPANRLYDIQGAAAYHQGLLDDPEKVGVHAINEHTLVVDLEEPVGYFLQSLSDCMPVPKHLVNDDGDHWALPMKLVGNGPYIIESWQPEEALTFIRNPRYRGNYSGNVQRIELPRLTPPKACSAYELDKLDITWLTNLSSDETAKLLQKYPQELVTQPILTTYILTINLNRKPFDDFRIRRALALALDKTRLIRQAFRWSFPAAGGFVPLGMPGHIDGIGIPYDAAQARMALAEAGYPQGHGIPELDLIAMKHWSWVLKEIADQWINNLGLKVNVRLLTSAEFYKAEAGGDYDVAFSGWRADFPDPDCFLRVGLGYLTNWSDEQYVDLVNRGRTISDRSRRLEFYRQAEMILAEQVPFIPLIYYHIGILLKPRIISRYYGYRGWLWKDIVID